MKTHRKSAILFWRNNCKVSLAICQGFFNPLFFFCLIANKSEPQILDKCIWGRAWQQILITAVSPKLKDQGQSDLKGRQNAFAFFFFFFLGQLNGKGSNRPSRVSWTGQAWKDPPDMSATKECSLIAFRRRTRMVCWKVNVGQGEQASK